MRVGSGWGQGGSWCGQGLVRMGSTKGSRYSVTASQSVCPVIVHIFERQSSGAEPIKTEHLACVATVLAESK